MIPRLVCEGFPDPGRKITFPCSKMVARQTHREAAFSRGPCFSRYSPLPPPLPCLRALHLVKISSTAVCANSGDMPAPGGRLRALSNGRGRGIVAGAGALGPPRSVVLSEKATRRQNLVVKARRVKKTLIMRHQISLFTVNNDHYGFSSECAFHP